MMELACPYCAGTDMEVEILHGVTRGILLRVAMDQVASVRVERNNPSRVCCKSCGAAGPIAKGPTFAIIEAAPIMAQGEMYDLAVKRQKEVFDIAASISEDVMWLRKGTPVASVMSGDPNDVRDILSLQGWDTSLWKGVLVVHARTWSDISLGIGTKAAWENLIDPTTRLEFIRLGHVGVTMGCSIITDAAFAPDERWVQEEGVHLYVIPTKTDHAA